MSKSVYSVVLMDDVVDAVDRNRIDKVRIYLPESEKQQQAS